MSVLAYRGNGRTDNGLPGNRRRLPAAPDLPTPQFRYEGNGNYEAIIPNADHGFTVKAYTPGKEWRIFHKAPDGVSVELEWRFPFDMAAVDIWNLLAVVAYRLTLDDGREAEVVTSPPASPGCPDDALIPW